MTNPTTKLSALLSVIDDDESLVEDGWTTCGAWKAQRQGSEIVIVGPVRKAFTADEVFDTARMLLMVEGHESGIKYAQEHYGLTAEQMQSSVDKEYCRSG